MLRSRSGWHVALLVLGVVLLFTPIAAASNAERAIQTLTLLDLMCALAGAGVTWLSFRRRGHVRLSFVVLGAFAGGLSAVWLLPVIHDFDGVSRKSLVTRLLLVVFFNAAGFALAAAAVRRLFAPRARALAVAAIALIAAGLFPAPLLLLQPSVASFNLFDPRPQLHASYLYWTVGAVLLVVPFLALMTLPGHWFEDSWARTSARIMAVPNRAFAVALVAAALGLSLFLAFYSFGGRPTTADEIAQLWHARMLVAGRLALPADPNFEFFAIDNVIDRPLWMSQFPIGGPAALAIGLALGAVWLLNPVLTALTALNVYRFAQRAYGEGHARAATAIFALSPMVLLMGGTHMNHMPTAWLVTLALAALPIWVASSEGEGRRLRRSAALIGGALGLAIAIRPLDGVVAALIVGILMLFFVARRGSAATGGATTRPTDVPLDAVARRARSILWAVAAGAIPVALLLVANWKTTGSPLRFGYEVLWGPNHSLGLHEDPTGHPHTAWRAMLLSVRYTEQLSWIVTNWPVPLLLVVAAGLLLATKATRWDALLVALVGAQIIVYAFYWHDGQFVGPRFLFTAVPALLILAARAPFIAAERLRGVWWRVAIVTIPVCIGVSWLRYMPPFGMRGLAQEFRESRSELKLELPREIERGSVDKALIFVQEGASARLVRRIWGLGVSRPDAARILAAADACSLLEAVRAEERRPPADTAGRLQRLETIRRFPSGEPLRAPDPYFHVTATSLTPACKEEIALDARLRNTVAFGPMLLLNRFDAEGRIAGPAVYVMNLGEHNAALRTRFADRRWYRYEMPATRPAGAPILVPYDSLP